MKLRVYSRLQKQMAGTTSSRLFDQDMATDFGQILARAAGATANGMYDVDLFLIGLALLNRKKMKKMVRKDLIQKAVQRQLRTAQEVLDNINALLKHQKQKPGDTDEEADEFDDWSNENENLLYAVSDSTDSNAYNPWPLNLTGPILLSYLSGYRVPSVFIKAFKRWITIEKMNGTDKSFLKYFEAFIQGIEQGKLNPKVLLTNSMWTGYLLHTLEGGSSANFERELIRMGLSTKEEIKSTPFKQILKRIVTEWKAK